MYCFHTSNFVFASQSESTTLILQRNFMSNFKASISLSPQYKLFWVILWSLKFKLHYCMILFFSVPLFTLSLTYAHTHRGDQPCAHGWWGYPTCGPCNCDVSKGFKRDCNKTTGECSCKVSCKWSHAPDSQHNAQELTGNHWLLVLQQYKYKLDHVAFIVLKR